MSSLFRDLRYALRQLRKNSGVTATALLALALGIGLSATLFSIFYNGVINPFPYRAANRLTVIAVQDPKIDQDRRSMFHLDEVAAYREGNHTFEDIVAYGDWDVVYRNDSETIPIHGCAMTPNGMDFWGVSPLLGRGIGAGDAKPGAPAVALLGYAFWKKSFNSDRSILGQTMMLDGHPRTIIGVMPPRFGLYGADLYVPLDWNRPEPSLTDAMNSNEPTWFFATGIRKQGISLQAAGADLQTVAQQRIVPLHPKDYPDHFKMLMRPMNDVIVADFKQTLFLLIAAVALLLLISSSNVASLLLTQHTARARETSLRAALGASRGQLIRQFLVEALLLGLAGCAAGCFLAFLGLRIVTLVPGIEVPGEADLSLNWTVLLFAVLLSLITTLIFGLFPALAAVKKTLWRNLQTAGVNVNANSGSRTRGGLVIFQVALSMLLLVFAGLMMRSFLAITQTNSGISTQNLWTAEIDLPPHQYTTVEKQRALFDDALGRVRHIPGVSHAAISFGMPALGMPDSGDVSVSGLPHDKKQGAAFDGVSDDYFTTLGLQLLRGRTFTSPEIASGARIAVVNRAFVRAFFNQSGTILDPIGRQIRFNDWEETPIAPHNAYFQIVGIVEDYRNNGPQQDVTPEAYLPYTIVAVPWHRLITRTSVPPGGLAHDVSVAISAADPNVALTHQATIDQALESDVYMKPKFRLISFGICAGIGLGLALIGLFGIMAYTVALQTHDFGVRLALGAQSGNILVLVLRKGMILVGSGIGLGLVASLLSVRLLKSQLWGVSAFDLGAFGIAPLALLITGLLACYIPARRAMKLDPMIALRHD